MDFRRFRGQSVRQPVAANGDGDPAPWARVSGNLWRPTGTGILPLLEEKIASWGPGVLEAWRTGGKDDEAEDEDEVAGR